MQQALILIDCSLCVSVNLNCHLTGLRSTQNFREHTSTHVCGGSPRRISWGEKEHTECVGRHLMHWNHGLNKERKKEKSMWVLASSSPPILIYRDVKKQPPVVMFRSCSAIMASWSWWTASPELWAKRSHGFLESLPVRCLVHSTDKDNWNTRGVMVHCHLGHLSAKKRKTGYISMRRECGSRSLWFYSANIQFLELVAKGLTF